MSRNEAQTRRDLIDPLLHKRGWPNHLVKVEVTPGKTDLINGVPKKRKGRTDYLLCLPPKEKSFSPFPIAILEAKKESDPPFVGLNQAITYRERFNVPFTFSTNGHLYCDASSDLKNIKESIDFKDFPTPDQIKKRYENLTNFNLNDELLKPLFIPYKGGDTQRFYFQDAAIRQCITNIAAGNKRILLSLATGTGKTVLVKHLLWKLSSGGQLKRVLFLVDRDELRTQALQHLQDMFSDNAQEIKPNKETNAKILIGTFQTLNTTDEDDEPKFWKDNFPKNYFSHIIIDECHRSAWGKWSIILKDNPDAVHIGLTATPRKLIENNSVLNVSDSEITSNNLKYFGNPVYEYKISDAQEDGYLAACEVNPRYIPFDKEKITKQDIMNLNASILNTGKTPTEQQIKDKYTSKNFDKDIILDDRVNSMSEMVFEDLLKTGTPHQKSIIFCNSDVHASLVQFSLQKIYNNWCEENGKTKYDNFVFKCTHSETNPKPKELISDFKASKNSHFIATTVDLLSTGVDIPNLNNIIFFNNIDSPISFYQMVGRGTRIGDPRGSKLMFRIYDYTNATRLFGEDFISSPPTENSSSGTSGEKKEIIRIANNQYDIQIINDAKLILGKIDGKDELIPYDEYKNKIIVELIDKIKNIDGLRNVWIQNKERNNLIDSLFDSPNSLQLIRQIEKMENYDLFDVLSKIGFSLKPFTTIERSENFLYKNEDWILNYPLQCQNIIKSLSKQFSKGGIEELETPHLFDEKEILLNGGIDYLNNINVNPKDILNETKYRLLI